MEKILNNNNLKAKIKVLKNSLNHLYRLEKLDFIKNIKVIRKMIFNKNNSKFLPIKN